ncbi:MAG: tRNA-dihydrouridine synthase family protein [Muribaculaceae bacterium]|nr:tRNA-dihydrouridine synthase family protein [Muribaculaceae bacterium]
MEKDFKLMVAPLQGLTEAAWRSEHFRLFGERQGEVEYFTPFIRVEKGEVRARDLRDFTSVLNQGMNLTPQIIFRDIEEWKLLVDKLAEARATRIDMNMGCPFPPQVGKGRGVGMLSHPDVVAEIATAMKEYSDSIEFSVKMRLGIKDPEEALELVGILNSMPLRHVTIHPRTASQQYKGELLFDNMAAFTSKLRHSVIFNGEISTLADIHALASRYDGVMVGRGLLRHPALFAEYRGDVEMTAAESGEAWMELIKATASALGQRLCGDTQLRDKMKPYWEYVPDSMDRKTVKLGKKKGITWQI